MALEIQEVKKLIDHAITHFSLNLTGKVVYTEAGSSSYIVTPLIAACAGAHKVYAIIADSRFGKKEDIRDELAGYISELHIDPHVIEVVFEKKAEHISQADIVTNLGFVRPIDSDFISHMKKGACVTLMWETWEFRECDMDIRELWRKNVPIIGTDEHTELMEYLDYIGPLATLKLTQEGVQLEGNAFLVIGNTKDLFSGVIAKELVQNGAECYMITNQSTEEVVDLGATHLCNSVFDEGISDMLSDLPQLSGIIVSTYPDERCMIGKDGLDVAKIKQLFPDVTCMQFKGIVDRNEMKSQGLKVIPQHEPRPEFMAYTPVELGPEPIVMLHTAGLKTGEVLSHNLDAGLEMGPAIEKSMNDCVLCQDFSDSQKEQYGFPGFESNDYAAEYSLEKYDELLSLIANEGYSCVDYSSCTTESLDGKNILLRHDVNYSCEWALQIAQREKDAGVTSTFFFHTRSPIYNIESFDVQEMIEKIIALGHRAGVIITLSPQCNFDDGAEISTFVREECARAQECVNGIEPLVVWHNPPLSQKQCAYLATLEIEGIQNIYNPHYMERIEMISDACWVHSFDELCNKVRKWESNTPLCLSLHPMVWCVHAASSQSAYFHTYLELIREHEAAEFMTNHVYSRVFEKGLLGMVDKEQWSHFLAKNVQNKG